MQTGEFTTTSTLTAQSVTPSTTAGLNSGAVIYSNSDTGALRYGFVEGAVVTLSSASYGEQTATIAAIEVGAITFTAAISAETSGGDTITKDYAGPHQTQVEANRKRLLGLR